MSYSFAAVSLPGGLALPGLDLTTEVVQGLTWVRGTSTSPLIPPKVNPVAGVALPVEIVGTSTTFMPSSSDLTTTQRGSAQLAVPPHPNENWVINSALLGNAVLIKPAGASLDVVVTKSPAFVAANAGVFLGGTYALIASDQAVLAAAIPLAVKPWGGGCQEGFTPSADGKTCVPVGSGGQPTPQQASTMPKWALPVGLAAGAGLLAFAVFSKRRKGATVKANWR